MDPRFAMNAFTGAHAEVISIPDRMVGLSKGGEQITAIQTESDCKVQFAPDSSGMPERSCTLTGTPEAIQKAKDLIGRIMNKGHDIGMGGGGGGMRQGGDMMHNDGSHQMLEIMIPGNKAGIIIGKGGDTIKQLQERAGVRMVIIQESNSPTNYDKPLRITGDRMACQRARDMVMELLAEKDNMIMGGGGGGGGGGGYGEYGHRNNIDLPVPRSMIGIVIGKGGEMIKKIQQESGARIQFKPEDEQGGPNRMCSVMGSHEQTQSATNMIQELIENAMQRQGGGDNGSSGGWGGGRPQMMGGMDGIGSRARFGNGSGGMNDETTYSVPADKCGLVIGKGGETIREICRQSGAHVELNRDQTVNSLERVFRVQGSATQIQSAIQLINEKAGVISPRDGSLGGSGGGGMGLGGVFGGGISMMTTTQPTMNSIYGQQASQAVQQQQQQPLQQFALPGQYQFQQYSQPTANDINKQAVEANAAAWAAYYAQCYSQLGTAPQSTATATAVAAVQQQPQQSPYAAVLPRTTITPQPSLASLQQQQQQQQQHQTAAPDYTAAWADYYRQQGLHQQAQAILMQSGLQQQQQ